jgi:hypothetical protein
MIEVIAAVAGASISVAAMGAMGFSANLMKLVMRLFASRAPSNILQHN